MSINSNLTKQEKLTLFRTLLDEITLRADRKGIRINPSRFPGSKRDLLHLYRTRMPPGVTISESSLEDYKREFGIKFPPSTAEDKTLRFLFAEVSEWK
jgi:hypothetical protein